MRRYLPSSRSRSNTDSTSAIGNQLIREFTAQAQAIMEELSSQFADNLQAQAAQVLQNQVSSFSGGANLADTASGGGEYSTAGALGQLANTFGRYLVSRPKTTRDSAETSRSVEASQLRASSSQAAAAAQQALSKGDKNL